MLATRCYVVPNVLCRSCCWVLVAQEERSSCSERKIFCNKEDLLAAQEENKLPPVRCFGIVADSRAVFDTHSLVSLIVPSKGVYGVAFVVVMCFLYGRTVFVL